MEFCQQGYFDFDCLTNWLADSHYAVVGMCLFLFLLFLYGLKQSLHISFWIEKRLKQASRTVQRLCPDSGTKEFYEQFDVLGRELEEDVDGFKPYWREFSESTFKDDARKFVCLSRRPNQYFYKQALLSNRGNLKQALSFPNYLVGFGLFFTFLGLAAALHVAQAGLGNNDPEALNKLLKVASIKFISSLTAILLSVILSIIQHIKFNSCQREIRKFCALIEERTEFLPSEKLLMRALIEQEKQTAYQADMAQNIAVNLGELLAKSLPDSVAEALAPLASEIKELAGKFSGSNENALQQVLQEFMGQLRQTAGQDMDGLISSVQVLRDTLDKLVVNMEGLGRNFGQDTRDSTARLAQCLESFTETFMPVQQGLGQFGKALIALEGIAAQIQQAGGNITGAANSNKEAAGNFANVMNDASTQITPIKEALVDLRGAMQAITDTAQKIQQAGNNMDTAATNILSSAGEMSKSQNNFADKIVGFSQTAENVAKTITGLERASEHIEGAIIPLQQASLGVVGVAEAIKMTETRIQESGQKVANMMSHIDETMKRIPEVLTAYEARFGNVDKDLAQAFDKLAEGAGGFRSSAEDFLVKLDGSFSQALNSLTGVVHEMMEEREAAQVPHEPAT